MGGKSESVQVPEGEKETEEDNNTEDENSPVEKVKVKKVKIKKVVQTKKLITIVLEKNKYVDGYIIAYRKGRKGKLRKVIVKDWKKNKVVLNGLKNKGKYSVKVRGYKEISGKIYCSKYSKAKSFKVNK